MLHPPLGLCMPPQGGICHLWGVHLGVPPIWGSFRPAARGLPRLRTAPNRALTPESPARRPLIAAGVHFLPHLSPNSPAP